MALVAHGPTLQVHIGFDPAFQPVTPIQRPNVPAQDFFALVDTGATECCIDSALAAQLGLPIVDRQSISGVSGLQQVSMHLAQIYVPSLAFTMWGRFAGVNLLSGGQPHQALIGRAFLAHFTMIYDGTTGEVTLLY